MRDDRFNVQRRGDLQRNTMQNGRNFGRCNKQQSKQSPRRSEQQKQKQQLQGNQAERNVVTERSIFRRCRKNCLLCTWSCSAKLRWDVLLVQLHSRLLTAQLLWFFSSRCANCARALYKRQCHCYFCLYFQVTQFAPWILAK